MLLCSDILHTAELKAFLNVWFELVAISPLVTNSNYLYSFHKLFTSEKTSCTMLATSKMLKLQRQVENFSSGFEDTQTDKY
ncbi:CLUMA_CG014138, isoform A [Clunio marinus]|uniref:CLUMA_CG014138, isoform A n=1 Tax=Clunio marinus TaxID=568069 RepID=A0A1J1IKX4_9DIPT|nr:CLUMA_CG014138, isoform A [Clunio marinus]